MLLVQIRMILQHQYENGLIRVTIVGRISALRFALAALGAELWRFLLAPCPELWGLLTQLAAFPLPLSNHPLRSNLARGFHQAIRHHTAFSPS
jgi:hypothetical protein